MTVTIATYDGATGEIKSVGVCALRDVKLQPCEDGAHVVIVPPGTDYRTHRIVDGKIVERPDMPISHGDLCVPVGSGAITINNLPDKARVVSYLGDEKICDQIYSAGDVFHLSTSKPCIGGISIRAFPYRDVDLDLEFYSP